ncbi:hypothetical protein ABFV80_001263 [Vandammella animalimorsus]|uniref:hypothetical protein n=1 Tax=Vandammella animalimorsus TaxID=2029117 RepID=UPI00325B5DD3
MAYEIKRLVDKAEKETIWREIDAADGFENIYFSLNKEAFLSMDRYISYSKESGNWLISFLEPYDPWRYFLFCFAGSIYLMKARIGNKFYAVSHVPERVREDFIGELKDVFLERAFDGPPLRKGDGVLQVVRIDNEVIDFL